LSAISGSSTQVVILRYGQFLTYLILVRVAQFIAISVEDTHVLVRIAIELLADLESVSPAFDRIGLAALTTTANRSPLRMALVHSDISGDIVHVRADQFDLIPELVLGIVRRRSGFDEELIVLHMQVLELMCC
jgi:hypothetical protein